MIEVNTGEYFTAEEVKKALYRIYQFEGKVYTELSYLEVKGGIE